MAGISLSSFGTLGALGNFVVNLLGAPGIIEDIVANRPAASSGNTGVLFVATDTHVLYRSNGATWDVIGATSGLTGAVNGLSVSGSNAVLGGSLTGTTTVNIVPSFVLSFQDTTTLTTFLQLVSGGTSRATLGITRTGPLVTKLEMVGAGLQVYDDAGFGLIGISDFSAAAAANNKAYIQKVFADANYAGLSNVVLLTTNQTVNGNKIFTGDTTIQSAFEADSTVAFPGIFTRQGGYLILGGGGALSQKTTMVYGHIFGSTDYLQVGDVATNNVVNSAIAVFQSTSNLGVLMPTMTAAQRLALDLSQNNSTGLLVYQTDGTPGFYELQANNSANWKRMLTTDDISAGPAIVATDKVAGVTASENLITYATAAGTSRQYRLNVSAVLRSVTAGTVTATYSYTDSAGNSRTGSFFSQGATVAALSALGNSGFPPALVYANPATNITIDVTITGTVIADFAAAIELIN